MSVCKRCSFWCALALASSSLLAMSSAQAQTTYTWLDSNVTDSTPVTLDWFSGGTNTQANWSSSPGVQGSSNVTNADTVQFFTNSTTSLPNTANVTLISNINNAGTAVQLGTLTLTGRASDTNTRTLTVNIGGDAINFSAATGTINLDATNQSTSRNIVYNLSSSMQLGTGSSTTALTFTGSGNSTFNFTGNLTELSAGSSITKSGSSRLILAGNSTYTGNTFVNQGTLQIGSNVAAFSGAVLGGGDYSGSIFIGTGATFLLGSHVNQTLSGIISGDGNLIKSQSGTLTLGNNNTYTGQTTITPTNSQDATISITSFNSVVGGTASSSLGAPTTVANGTIVLGNVASGRRAAIIYTGAGETTDRVINFAFNNNGSQHTISNTGAGLLRFTSAAIRTSSTSGGIILGGDGNGEFTQGLPFDFSNLTKNGNGTWTLGGAVGSGFSAAAVLTVNAGTLVLQKKSSLQNGNTANWTAAKINVKSGATLALNVDSGDVDGLSATSLDTLLTNIYGGTSTAQGLQAGAILGLNTSTATGGSFTQGNAITNSTGTGGGALALTKLGTGTLVLDKANTYTGNTTVSAGTLLINGDNSAATGAVNIAAGATLGGNGTIGGAVTFTGASFLTPGNSPGQLTMPSLSLAAETTTTMELGGTTLGTLYDNITVTSSGALTYGGILDVIDFGLHDMDAGSFTYDLFSFTGSPSGSFADVFVNAVELTNDGFGVWMGSNGPDVDYTFTQSTGNLVITVVPEPGTMALLAGGAVAGVALLRRRRNNVV